MHRRRFQSVVAEGHLTLFFSLVFLLGCWLLGSMLPQQRAESITLFHAAALNRCAALAIYIGIGVSLIYLNNIFVLMRVKASVQTASFFALIAMYPLVHDFNRGLVAAIIGLMMIYLLFFCYQRAFPQKEAFYSSTLISIGTLIYPEMLLLLPVCWMGLLLFRAFNIKSLFASLLGLLTPFWVVWFYLYFMEGDTSYFDQLLQSFPVAEKWLSMEWSIPEVVTACFMGLFSLITIVHYLYNENNVKIKTRSYFRFLILLNVYLLLLIAVFPPMLGELYALASIAISILAGYFIVSAKGKAANILFSFMVASLIIIFVLFVVVE